MSAASRAVPAVPANVTEFPSFDPFEAAEGFFPNPKRIFAPMKGRLMSVAQLWLILYLASELWGSRRRKGEKGERVAPAEWSDSLTLEKLAKACGVGTIQGVQLV